MFVAAAGRIKIQKLYQTCFLENDFSIGFYILC